MLARAWVLLVCVGFLALLIALVVMERWVDVAIMGGGLVLALVILRAQFRRRTDISEIWPGFAGGALPPPAAIPPSDGGSADQVETGPGEPDESPYIKLSPGAVAALRARGGKLYLLADKAGLLLARVTPPAELVIFDSVVIDGCSIYVERTMAPLVPGSFWWITWRRFPRPHFAAITTWKRGTGEVIVDAIGDSLPPWPF